MDQDEKLYTAARVVVVDLILAYLLAKDAKANNQPLDPLHQYLISKCSNLSVETAPEISSSHFQEICTNNIDSIFSFASILTPKI